MGSSWEALSAEAGFGIHIGPGINSYTQYLIFNVHQLECPLQELSLRPRLKWRVFYLVSDSGDAAERRTDLGQSN